MQMVQQSGNVKLDSGYLTIDADTDTITVNHNLGVVPNFAMIWVATDDYDIIPFGSCVAAAYQKMQYTTITSATNTLVFNYIYQYKHATSGNLLAAQYALASNEYSDSVFKFRRGGSSWKKNDVNGNLLTYKYFVGYFPD